MSKTPKGNTIQNVEHLKQLRIPIDCSSGFEMQKDHVVKSSSDVAS